jgi:hypothetical protein
MINMPLSEAEAFAGTILGRQGGAQGKPLRELSKTMRERFTAVAEYYTIRMIHGDAAIHEEEYLDNLYDLEEREIEAWPRTIACLVVACREVGLQDIRLGELKSFKYIAAASCLKEFEHQKGSGEVWISSEVHVLIFQSALGDGGFASQVFERVLWPGVAVRTINE